MDFILTFAVVLGSNAAFASAEPAGETPRQRWERMAAVKDRELLADPTSYLNLNDVAYLDAGGKVFLDLAAPHDKGRWLKERPGTSSSISLENRGGRAVIRAGSAEEVSLGEGNLWNAPNGLVVQASTGGRLWAFLFDPKNPRLASFHGLSRFPYDPSAAVEASFERFAKPQEVWFPTSQKTLKKALKVGRLAFSLGGKRYALEAFTWRDDPDEIRELFIPFRDLTTGKETYGGGRYLEPRLPNGLNANAVLLDFNEAHNPTCARSPFFNCPIYAGNKLPLALRAGEMAPPRH